MVAASNADFQPGTHLGGHLALVRRLVREHGLADDVADGEDVRHVGALLFVHGYEAVLVYVNARLVRADTPAVWPPPHRHQDAVEALGLPCPGTVQADLEPSGSAVMPVTFGAQHDAFVLLLDALLQGRTRSGSQPGIKLSSSSTTVMLAPSAWYTAAISRPMIPPPIINMTSRISSSASASVESIKRGSSFGNDGICVACEPAAMMAFSKACEPCPLRSPPRAYGADEAAVTLHGLHLALLGEPGQSFGQTAHHRVLPAAQLLEIQLGRTKDDAVLCHRAGLFDDLRGVQQRLGRDAADVETNTAQRRVALDQDGLLAEVGGPKRGRVATGPGTQDDDLRAEVRLGCRAGAGACSVALSVRWPGRRLVARPR